MHAQIGGAMLMLGFACTAEFEGWPSCKLEWDGACSERENGQA